MAANFKVDEARPTNNEENSTPARLLTNAKENTSQSELVTPPGVSGETAGPDNLLTEALAPSTHCKPTGGLVAVTSEDSARPTTTQSLVPESDRCEASTSRRGEKRKSESDDSSYQVKRPSKLSGAKEEKIQDYDVKCAELWIQSELAACESYEWSELARRNQYLLNELVSISLQATPSMPLPKPVTQRLHDRPASRTKLEAGFQKMTRLLHESEVLQRAHFTELMTGLDGMRRNVAECSNEIHAFRKDQRVLLETLKAFGACLLEMHRMMTGRK